MTPNFASPRILCDRAKMPSKGHLGSRYGWLFRARDRLGRTLGPIQLADRAEVNFRDASLDVVLAGVGAAAQFARDLDVRALREGLGDIAELAPGDDAMPLGARHAFARLLVEPGQERLVATDRTTKLRLFLLVRS